MTSMRLLALGVPLAVLTACVPPTGSSTPVNPLVPRVQQAVVAACQLLPKDGPVDKLIGMFAGPEASVITSIKNLFCDGKKALENKNADLAPGVERSFGQYKGVELIATPTR